ncbi:hypothetical protein BGZ98_000469 [Dissophora globulifera]|nr:hypothetical protein BGZ98_000469 [Dissophora globulifera]
MINSPGVFFILEGQSTSREIELTIPLSSSGSTLRLAIKNRKPMVFEQISEELIEVWCITVPTDSASAHEPIVLSTIESKQEVLPFRNLSSYVGPNEDNTATIFIVRETHLVYINRRFRQIEVEVSFDDSEPPKSMMWNFELNKISPAKLEVDICLEFPGLADDHRALTIVIPPSRGHPKFTVFEPVTDYDLQSIIRQFAEDGVTPLRVNFKIAPIPFSKTSIVDALLLYDIPRLEVFRDLPAVPFTSDKHVQALDQLHTQLEALIDVFPLDLEEDSQIQSYIFEFLLKAVSLFPGWRLKVGKEIHCSRAQGRTDYTIESKEDSLDAFPITIIRNQDVDLGIAQNMMQLDAISCGRKREVDIGIAQNKMQLDTISRRRKRKFEEDEQMVSREDKPEENREDDEASMVSYGIVTDAETWHVVKCTTKLGESSAWRLPTFRRATLPRVDFAGDHWKEDVKNIFGVIIRLNEIFVNDVKMHQKRREYITH